MKGIIRCLVLTSAAVFISCGSAAAYLTTINPTGGGNGSEPSLFQIMNTLYGSGNYSRVEDSSDQVWRNISGSATALAKYASYSQTFGYIPDTDLQFHTLFTVTESGYLSDFGSSLLPVGPTAKRPPSASLAPGSYNFLFGDNPNAAADPPMWTSQPSMNEPLFYDHMVTFSLADGRYVIAWEDMNLGDYDYNDLVVEVAGVAAASAVPEPAAVLLIGSGLLGFMGLRKGRMWLDLRRKGKTLTP